MIREGFARRIWIAFTLLIDVSHLMRKRSTAEGARELLFSIWKVKSENYALLSSSQMSYQLFEDSFTQSIDHNDSLMIAPKGPWRGFTIWAMVLCVPHESLERKVAILALVFRTCSFLASWRLKIRSVRKSFDLPSRTSNLFCLFFYRREYCIKIDLRSRKSYSRVHTSNF